MERKKDNMSQTYIKTKDNIDLCCKAPWCFRGWEEIKAIANGCGPGGWKIDIVPDKIWGCPVVEACNIHDLDYEEGRSIADKDVADRTLLNNLLRLVESRTTNWFAKKLLLKARKNTCYIYYEAVHKFGGPAFWDKGKK
jgi:hypothetical protein